MEALSVILNIHGQTQFCLGLGFPNLFPNFLYNSSVSFPGHLSSFLLPERFFFCSVFAQQLLIHPGWSPSIFAWFPPCWMSSSWAWKRWSLKFSQHSCDPLPSRTLSHGTVLNSPWRGQSLPGKWTCSVPSSLPWGSWIPLCCDHCWNTALPTSSSLLVSTRSSRAPSCWLSSTACVQKLLLTHVRDYVLLCCPSNRYHSGWNPPWGLGLETTFVCLWRASSTPSSWLGGL